MKKIFLFATTLMLMTGISKASKNEVPATTNASTIDNKATVPAVSATVSMADMVKENQNLKLALLKANTENETLSNQLSFAHNLHFATTALYEVELVKKDEKAKDAVDYAWLMSNVLTTLAALPKQA